MARQVKKCPPQLGTKPSVPPSPTRPKRKPVVPMELDEFLSFIRECRADD